MCSTVIEISFDDRNKSLSSNVSLFYLLLKSYNPLYLIQEEFSNLLFEPCRLHVLDLVLKHQFAHYFKDQTTSSDLQYDFVSSLQKNWKTYRQSYLSTCSASEVKESDLLPGSENRRGDYQFLLKLVLAVKFHREENEHSLITNYPNNPTSINLARWNSRAIYSLLAELCGFTDNRIFKINTFIIEVR